MNYCALSGWLSNDPEVRFSSQHRRYLAFVLNVETQSGFALYVLVKFFCTGDMGLKAGDRVMVIGSLRFGGPLFLSAQHIGLIAGDRAEETAAELKRGTEAEQMWQSAITNRRES